MQTKGLYRRHKPPYLKLASITRHLLAQLLSLLLIISPIQPAQCQQSLVSGPLSSHDLRIENIDTDVIEWRSKEDATGGCLLPGTWLGRWQQQIERSEEPVEVRRNGISDKGVCRDEMGDKYLFEMPETGCLVCLVISERKLEEANELQYKESKCHPLSSTGNTSSITSSDHSLLEKVCSSITGNTQIQSMFRPLSFQQPSKEAPAARRGREIGEGLTLSHKFSGNSRGQQQQQHRLRQHQELSAEDVSRIKAENRVSAQLGQNVILNCPVQFKDGRERLYALEWLKHPHKLPIYLWHAGYPDHKAAGYESRVQRLGVASLNLSQVRETDQGLYECHIYYLDERPEDGAAKPTRLFLDVLAPPRITIEPSPVSYVQAGDSLHLTCQAESMPAPVLRWYKNKQPIDSSSGGYRTSSVIVDEDEDLLSPASADAAPEMQRLRSQEDLFIDNIQAGQQTGNYRCLASNSEGSVEAHAQVILGVPAVITGAPRNQLKLEGERAEFQCQAKALPSNITHHWFFNDKPIEQLKWFENRHSVRRDGTLILPSVHRDDQGQYKCQASNGLSHKAPTSGAVAEASASLIVEFPARVTQSPSLQYLPLGLSGLVRCHVHAVPPVEFFTWTLNNQQFDAAADPNIERLLNGSLLVKQVTKNYRGTYRCTPFNKHGTAGSSGAMEVRVEEPPVFVMRPADFYKAAAGGHVSMPCEARGEPAPSVTWRRVVGSSGPGGSGASWSQQTGSKSAPPKTSSPDDADWPPLQPNDEPGSEEHELYARSAPASPRNSLLTPYETEADEATSKREKQSVIVYAPPPAERSDYKNSHLLLHGLRKEDHGRYECVIENEVATLVASTMLYIEETSPHAPTNVQVDAKRWSAIVSWTPGYDGGFEQSFTVWYRQVGQQQAASGALDLNWRSASVKPPDATSAEVQNLTQNTAYEFCVHAKNIIGEGPRSQVVLAHTKRAILSQLGSQTQDEGKPEDAESTMNPSILGIIHLVDYTTAGPRSVGGATGSSTQQQAESASETFVQLYPTASQTQEPPVNSSASSSSSKVIKIILPDQPYLNSTSSSSSSSSLASAEDPLSTNSLTAPQNLKINKVAQGWVLSWSPPPIVSTFGHRSDAAATVAAPAPTVAASQVLDNQRPSQAAGGGTTYLLEFREKGGSWHTVVVPQTQERSMLLKDLKPGAEYLFRVYAADSLGQRGAPSRELSQAIPDYRRKPGSTQALSAGVVSGMLFFIACIVIAVCTVNMCNKRRKKRAEKAAYVMMACPVLETHHNIEALNTNSLMKNAYGTKNRVSGVSYNTGRQANNKAKLIDKLSSSLRRMGKRLFEDELSQTPPPPPTPPPELHKLPLTRCIRYSASRPALPVDVGDAPLELPGRATTPSDDYWLLEPADSKWGTLTVATSKLAERRARQAYQAIYSRPDASKGAPKEEPPATTNTSIANPPSPSPKKDNNLQLQSQLLFELWLAKQLAGQQSQLVLQEAIPASAAESQLAPVEASGGAGRGASAGVPSAFAHQPTPCESTTNWHTGHSASFTYQRQQTPSSHHFQLQPSSGSLLVYPATTSRMDSAHFGAGCSPEQTMHLQRRANSSYLTGNGHWTNQERSQQFIGESRDQVAPQHHQQHQHQSNEDHNRLGRNSIARRTLPLTAVNFMGQQQQLVYQAAPDYHHKSPASAAQQQHHYFQSQHQPLPPPANFQQQHHNTPHWPVTDAADRPHDAGGAGAGDDPLTENACFGSYKRKRRLPHIEAQFTITPPQPHPRHLFANECSLHHENHLHVSEREALESGHLFVRPTSKTLPNRPAPLPPPPPSPPPPLSSNPLPLDPPGMPSPGQRTEQRRLRGPLPQVGTMGAKEKIETYLRHYNEAQREPMDWLIDGDDVQDYEVDRKFATKAEAEEAASVVQTTEQQLIFQPYCNMPSLKYTISLPLIQTRDGSIVVGETNELRLSQRSSRSATHRWRTLSGGGETLDDIAPPPVPPAKTALLNYNRAKANKQRLGSSSSCPPVPHHLTKDLQPIKKHDKELGKHSLESCLRYSQAYNRLLAITSPLDSLDSVSGSDVQPTTKPFYLHPLNQANSAVFLPAELPPPPVPPHKNTCSQPPTNTLSPGKPTNEASTTLKDNNQLAFIQKNSESSNSPQSSSTSSQPPARTCDLSPSSSVTTTHENHSGNENCGPMSEVPTNSVDENYEFDQLSSSSSSIHLRQKFSKRLRPPTKSSAMSQVSTTTTTGKQTPTGSETNNELATHHHNISQRLSTRRSYISDYSTCKIFPLTQALTQAEVGSSTYLACPQTTNTDFYDTVYGETSVVDKSTAPPLLRK